MAEFNIKVGNKFELLNSDDETNPREELAKLIVDPKKPASTAKKLGQTKAKTVTGNKKVIFKDSSNTSLNTDKDGSRLTRSFNKNDSRPLRTNENYHVLDNKNERSQRAVGNGERRSRHPQQFNSSEAASFKTENQGEKDENNQNIFDGTQDNADNCPQEEETLEEAEKPRLQLTLEEYKQQVKLDKPQFNLRKAGEGADSKILKKLIPIKRNVQINNSKNIEESDKTSRKKNKSRPVLLDVQFNYRRINEEAHHRGSQRRGGPSRRGGGHRGGSNIGRTDDNVNEPNGDSHSNPDNLESYHPNKPINAVGGQSFRGGQGNVSSFRDSSNTDSQHRGGGGNFREGSSSCRHQNDSYPPTRPINASFRSNSSGGPTSAPVNFRGGFSGN